MNFIFLLSGLSQDIARTAVRFERACNPIVEAATNSYIKTFNKYVSVIHLHAVLVY